MAFLPAALPLISAGASLVGGVGGLVSGLQNKKRFNAQAREELSAGATQERELRQDARRAIGTQLAAQWGNGLEGGSGTAIDALRESETEAALDAAEIRRRAGAQARSYRAQGKQEAVRGAFDLAGGMLGAATGYSNARNDWAQARRGTTAGGGI